jgi:polyisoprenoid-binding protein YceI
MNTPSQVSVPVAPDRPRRRRRWLRWALAGVAALIVILVAAVVVAINLEPVPAPLGIPASVAPPAGPVDGTWHVASGSVAGFRIRQTMLGVSSYVVGRTEDVTGTVGIADGRVTTAHLRINLAELAFDGKPAPQFKASLETQRYPDATVSLVQPVGLGAAFASGAAATVTATGQLTLHGTTRPATVPLSVRRDAAAVDVAGSFPVTFADWGIPTPPGYGFFGSLADHGVAEFLLVLQQT